MGNIALSGDGGDLKKVEVAKHRRGERAAKNQY